MPQIVKGGKYIYGWLIIKSDKSINLPKMVIEEYKISDKDKCILFTGSKTTGGFCLSTISLLEKSMLKNILIDNRELWECRIPEQEFIKYKGRKYCWIPINCGKLVLNKNTLTECDLIIDDKLLSIRSSNIAFTLGVKGPIIEQAKKYSGEIEIF